MKEFTVARQEWFLSAFAGGLSNTSSPISAARCRVTRVWKGLQWEVLIHCTHVLRVRQEQLPAKEDNHEGHEPCKLGDGVTFNAIKRDTSEATVPSAKSDRHLLCSNLNSE